MSVRTQRYIQTELELTLCHGINKPDDRYYLWLPIVMYYSHALVSDIALGSYTLNAHQVALIHMEVDGVAEFPELAFKDDTEALDLARWTLRELLEGNL